MLFFTCAHRAIAVSAVGQLPHKFPKLGKIIIFWAMTKIIWEKAEFLGQWQEKFELKSRILEK